MLVMIHFISLCFLSITLRVISNDSGRLRAIPDDSERLWIMLGGPTFRSRFRNYRSRTGFDSEILPILAITIGKLRVNFVRRFSGTH